MHAHSRKVVYGQHDLKNFDSAKELGNPGEFPFTRGIHPEMYGKKKWTIRQFAGHGLASDTNARWKFLRQKGITGYSTPFDLPTLMGRDSDEDVCKGEVGWDGVAIDSIRDMEELLDGIAIDKETVSMTISGPAAIIWAMYIAVAKKRGIPLERLGGTIQNDILKEFAAQREWIFPEEPSMRLVTDTIEFATTHMPKWNPISISGYHIREAGSTAVQEAAFTLSDGIAYVREAMKRGLDVDEFAPRLSFFFDIHNDFFEEIAKLRASRKLWAYICRVWFGAKNPRSQWCRMHVQTAGCTLTRQEPLNNIIRVAYQALAGAFGGAQSMHTNSYDEVICTPTEEAARIAIRIQQILQEEIVICGVADPLGGSYFMESLTGSMSEEIFAEIQKIESMGGMLEAVKSGYPQKAIQESARNYAKDLHSEKLKIIGMTMYRSEEELAEPESVVKELAIRSGFEEKQLKRLELFKQERQTSGQAGPLQTALFEVRRIAGTNQNLMPALIEASLAGATLGEMVSALKDAWGVYEDKGLFMPERMDEDLKKIARTYRLKRPLRILLAKGGLDGHDRPIYILAPFLRDLGAEVIYPGLHLSTEALAKIAIEEGVDVVGISTHIGSPTALFENLMRDLGTYGHKNTKVIGGGIIRESELSFLKNIGISEFFSQEDGSYENIARFLKEMADV